MKTKNDKDKTYTYEEYIKKFFPKHATATRIKSNSPKDVGISLARSSLKKLNQALSSILA
jgi:hypothetical protein